MRGTDRPPAIGWSLGGICISFQPHLCQIPYHPSLGVSVVGISWRSATGDSSVSPWPAAGNDCALWRLAAAILSNDTGFLMTGWRCQTYGGGGCERQYMRPRDNGMMLSTEPWWHQISLELRWRPHGVQVSTLERNAKATRHQSRLAGSSLHPSNTTAIYPPLSG
jgi:hypothetical protein